MKKLQLKKRQTTGEPSAPRHTRQPKLAKSPKGTHRLYRRLTLPLAMLAGMAASWGLLTQLPKLAATPTDRDLLAFMYAGLAALVLVAAAVVAFVGGLRRMKASAAGKMGGGRQFIVAFFLLASAGIAFVAIRAQHERALVLWQGTFAGGVLVSTYLFGVKYASPFTKDGVCLDAPVGTVSDLAEGMGVAHEEAPTRLSVKESLGFGTPAAPEPPLAEPALDRLRQRFDWGTGQPVPLEPVAAPNGHGGG